MRNFEKISKKCTHFVTNTFVFGLKIHRQVTDGWMDREIDKYDT